MDGITALKKIRESDDKTYILMLTAKAEVDDRVTGLDSGADDYITKPFSLKELLARLRSKERREDDYTPNLLTVGDVTLNVEQQNLASHNSIQLSGPETQLMNYFLLNENKELSTEDIFNRVWKNDEDANPEVVWVYVSYLRQKLHWSNNGRIFKRNANLQPFLAGQLNRSLITTISNRNLLQMLGMN